MYIDRSSFANMVGYTQRFNETIFCNYYLKIPTSIHSVHRYYNN